MSDRLIELIVGLGNPGAEHQMDRHNVGFWFVDLLARQHGGTFRSERKFAGDLARIDIGRHDIRLLKPMTYMNRSGAALQSAAAYFKLPLNKVLVVHDDLDLPPGTVRLKAGGGHGGHNGLRDMIAQCGPEFYRLRIGIGHPGSREQVIGYVLRRADEADTEQIITAIADAVDVMPLLLGQGYERATHKLHSRGKVAKSPESKAGEGDRDGQADERDGVDRDGADSGDRTDEEPV